MMKFFSGFLVFILLASCYHSAPDPTFDMDLVLTPDSMITLLIDLHIAEGVVNTLKSKQQPLGHLSNEYFEAVLLRHSVSREAFEESMRYYSFHTEKLDKIYEKVIIDLSKKESLAHPGIETQKPAD